MIYGKSGGGDACKAMVDSTVALRAEATTSQLLMTNCGRRWHSGRR